MLNRIRWIVLAFAVIGLPLAANISWADHNDDERSRFEPLSKAHTDYGVSQYNYGIVPRAGGGPPPPAPGPGFLPSPMRLMNPNTVTQIAAVFVYTRGPLPDPGIFLGCVVRRLTPHGALDLTDPVVGGDFPTGDIDAFPVVLPGFPPRYAEVIWAPEEKVRVRGKRSDRRRLADGLGGRSQGAVNTSVHYLAHPSLFSLPSNNVVPGQREVAVGCVCRNLMELGLNTRTFKDFGIRCH